jgi:hypothetical protein
MPAGTISYAHFTLIIFHQFVGILFTASNQTVVISGPDPLTQSSSK